MASSSADRDRLFGWFALQTRLIDRIQLAAATQAWDDDRGRTLADHLSGRGDLDSDARAAVETLVSYHLRQHGGRAEETLATLGIGPAGGETLDAPGHPGALGAATADGRRFRVLRPHAQGGLGAVFVALDEELHREVALKQILENHADNAASRARFLLEAEITGSLEHPGIVPVYGLGTDAEGRPYYAMRFIRGETLAEAAARFHADEALQRDVGRRSLELRKLLRRFTDVCNAIEYAHSRGVLHRDVKPANVIVGQHGETLVVDWGLAKVMGGSDPGGEAADRAPVSPPVGAGAGGGTLPGSSMGTPAYMSPEQAEGDLERLGRRSDVYSLGGTLYHLLTGKPPVEGPVREVLRAVTAGEITPPRRRDPRIDRALEAVCQKAMAKRPDDRYATAKALAEDVERWMADEPVSAWREPFTRRARRWAKRNRTAVTAATVALVAGLAGLAAIAAVQARANGALAAKNEELTAANDRVTRANADLATANAKIEARYNLAVDAIRTFHTGVSEDFLLKEDRFKELRDRLLKSASRFYGKLGALLKDDADLSARRALLQANYEVADLAYKVGRREDALALHRRVLVDREALAASPGADSATAVDVARSFLAVGEALESMGRTDEALAAYELARSAVAAVNGEPPEAPVARSAFADAEERAGVLLERIGRTAEALRALERARDLQQALAVADPEDDDRQKALAHSHGSIGILLYHTGRPAVALPSFEAGQAIHQKLAEANPDDTRVQRELAWSQNNIGYLLSETGKPAEALAAYEAARAIRRRLADANPAVTQFQTDLAQSDYDIGNLLGQTGKPAEALTAHETARAIRRKLADANPAVTQFQFALACSHFCIGWLRINSGELDEAVAEFAREEEIWRKLADANPAVHGYREWLANCQTNAATALLRLRRPAAARGRCASAVALLEGLVREDPDLPQYRARLAEGLLRFGQARQADADLGGAAADWRRAVGLYETVANLDSENVILCAGCHALLSDPAGAAGSEASAGEREAEATRAMALLRKAAAMGYRAPATYRNERALDPLRGREDFRLLMMDLAFPAEPFAYRLDEDRLLPAPLISTAPSGK